MLGLELARRTPRSRLSVDDDGTDLAIARSSRRAGDLLQGGRRRRRRAEAGSGEPPVGVATCNPEAPGAGEAAAALAERVRPAGAAVGRGRRHGRSLAGRREGGRGRRLLRRRRPRRRRHRPRGRADDRRARPRAASVAWLRAQSRRARGLPQDRVSRSRSRRGGHRAPADLAHQSRRSTRACRTPSATTSRRSPLEHVLDAARDGDGVSISVMRDTAKYLGMAAANLVLVADPEMLVLGGIMAPPADLLLEPVRAEIARRLPRSMIDALTIAPATLGADAAGDWRGTTRRARAPDDRPVGRRAGAARPHPVAGHARHRGRPHRRDSAGAP